MIEVTKHNVYKVKNFEKHQNIGVKEKVEDENMDEDIRDDNKVINDQ